MSFGESLVEVPMSSHELAMREASSLQRQQQEQQLEQLEQQRRGSFDLALRQRAAFPATDDDEPDDDHDDDLAPQTGALPHVILLPNHGSAEAAPAVTNRPLGSTSAVRFDLTEFEPSSSRRPPPHQAPPPSEPRPSILKKDSVVAAYLAPEAVPNGTGDRAHVYMQMQPLYDFTSDSDERRDELMRAAPSFQDARRRSIQPSRKPMGLGSTSSNTSLGGALGKVFTGLSRRRHSIQPGFPASSGFEPNVLGGSIASGISRSETRQFTPPPIVAADSDGLEEDTSISFWTTLRSMMPTMLTSGELPQVSDKEFFLSYSRKDKATAARLVDMFTEANVDVWVDWTSIPPSADWMSEICKGIENSSAFLFLLSPNSVSSLVCNQELDYAIQCGKRVIPIVIEDIDASIVVRTEISSRNYIFMRQTDNGAESFKTIIHALSQNLDYVHEHTRILKLAHTWNDNHRKPDFLVFGHVANAAQQWLTDSVGQSPAPCPLQVEYIRACVRFAKRVHHRKRMVAIAFILVCIAAVIASTILAIQAKRNLEEAEIQRKTSKQFTAFVVVQQIATLSQSFFLEFTKRYPKPSWLCYTRKCIMGSIMSLARVETLAIVSDLIPRSSFRQSAFAALLQTRYTALRKDFELYNGNIDPFNTTGAVCEWSISLYGIGFLQYCGSGSIDIVSLTQPLHPFTEWYSSKPNQTVLAQEPFSLPPDPTHARRLRLPDGSLLVGAKCSDVSSVGLATLIQLNATHIEYNVFGLLLGSHEEEPGPQSLRLLSSRIFPAVFTDSSCLLSPTTAHFAFFAILPFDPGHPHLVLIDSDVDRVFDFGRADTLSVENIGFNDDSTLLAMADPEVVGDLRLTRLPMPGSANLTHVPLQLLPANYSDPYYTPVYAGSWVEQDGVLPVMRINITLPSTNPSNSFVTLSKETSLSTLQFFPQSDWLIVAMAFPNKIVGYINTASATYSSEMLKLPFHLVAGSDMPGVIVSIDVESNLASFGDDQGFARNLKCNVPPPGSSTVPQCATIGQLSVGSGPVKPGSLILYQVSGIAIVTAEVLSSNCLSGLGIADCHGPIISWPADMGQPITVSSFLLTYVLSLVRIDASTSNPYALWPTGQDEIAPTLLDISLRNPNFQQFLADSLLLPYAIVQQFTNDDE
ncbi:hypothetical protein CAOG_04582 [Capsaspora owczarzaki ATCC 30864]|uniref:TIR domain-containing protein n=1 Tax=Capsaspora owczarzaki (strain ATCC 30864) TaxID=595528 RepID=A0A0D2WRI3_CAPO3|nr:hypothetical protein CAOG_04582 [Capsaspora owczarzaki ATCC 30864]KJE93858.1 hypothetical protein, variant [Capsaspora owczarzaki ATCC 30864]|eukprot:XP_004347329.1 hypothetical protein CAOG_04582 [Capsaspora owczarzaki ATCC 30864]